MQALPSESELRRSHEDTVAVGKINREKPTWYSLKADLGPALTVTEHEDGTVTGRVEDHTPEKKYLRRLHGMTRRAKQLECELGAEIHSRALFVPLREPTGGLDYVLADLADKTARKRGLRPVIRWGRPSEPDERGCWRNGHTHLNDDPAPWQSANCPGCNDG